MKHAARGLLMLARWAIRTARRINPNIIHHADDPIADAQRVLKWQQERRR